MDRIRARQLRGFYENELTNRILFFWDGKCLDEVNGGYFNCFDNRGERLVSRDKYIWSQGRFLWMWSKLAEMEDGIFSQAQREEFLRRAALGKNFLLRHSLIAPSDWRCVFLTDEAGNPKLMSGWGDRLDVSIYADGFVVLGMARYAHSAGDEEAYTFAKKLFLSSRDRFARGDYLTLPYPMNPDYKAHGIPMTQIHIANELLLAARIFEPAWEDELKAVMRECVDEVLGSFVDGENLLREVVHVNGSHLPTLLGQHMNPGHILEEAWFLVDAADALGAPEYLPRIAAISRNALERGWDEEFGGLLHYCDMNGGQPLASPGIDAEEPMVQLVQRSWGDKLWWVHSEALYATLLLHARTGDASFLDWHDRIFAYAFDKHANPNAEVREWIQILNREGKPEDKVVALPVKDPYHISRNLIQILEHLDGALGSSQSVASENNEVK